jgi:hypothetical protein
MLDRENIMLPTDIRVPSIRPEHVNRAVKFRDVKVMLMPDPAGHFMCTAMLCGVSLNMQGFLFGGKIHCTHR